MSVRMRILQQFDPAREAEFMKLEQAFAQLEAGRDDYPKGKRMKPIAAAEPCNTLIWECEFADLNAARAALDLFEGDQAHEDLFVEQAPMFRGVRIEFYENLEF